MRIAALYMPLLSIVLENKERFRPILETNADAALGTGGNAEGELGATLGSSCGGRPPSTLFDAASVASQRTMIVNSASSLAPPSVNVLF